MNRSVVIHSSFFVLNLALVAGLAVAIGRLPSLPQVSSGDSVLSVVFGDTREVISRAAVERANNYFHGGVEIDCHGMHGHDHMEHCEHDHAHCHDGVCELGHDHDEGHDENCPFCRHEPSEPHEDVEEHEETASVEASSFPDPWDWINVRIRAPEIDRHLDSDKAVELMPWLWAAVRADPHNGDAWSTTWYIARCVIGDRDLANRVVAEAKAKNPDSIEVAFIEGRNRYDFGKGDMAAALVAFRRARALGDAKCGGDVTKLSEHEEEAYRFSANYAEGIEKKLAR